MKPFFVVVLVLSLVGTVRAERNPKYENWLTPDRLERWQSLSQDMDYTNLNSAKDATRHRDETLRNRPKWSS